MRVSRLLLALSLFCSALARGDPLQHEFLLLPSAQAIGTFDRQSPQTQLYDQVVQADGLLSLQKGRFKLFGEYLVSDHEGDLERFQLGWQISSDTIIWIGRYHQPTSVWNHDHHHGQYLQTSITRPAIDEWEDLRGILPQHFTGVLVESSRAVLKDWRLRTAVAGGIAPKLTNDGLEPFDLIHPDSGRRPGYQARASLHPGEFTENGVGVLAADDHLAASLQSQTKGKSGYAAGEPRSGLTGHSHLSTSTATDSHRQCPRTSPFAGNPRRSATPRKNPALPPAWRASSSPADPGLRMRSPCGPPAAVPHSARPR